VDKLTKKMYPLKLLVPALLIYSLFFVIPVIAAFFLGFTDWFIDRITSPKFNGLKNFATLYKDEYFWLALRNTLLFAISTVIFKTLFGLILAVILNQPMKSKNYLRTIFYLPAVLATVVVGLIFSSIFRTEGLLNNFLNSIGLGNLALDWLGDRNLAMSTVITMEVWKWSGLCMAIFLAGIQSISTDYYEAARIDGATNFQQFRKITLPLLVPAFTVVVTTNVIGGLKVFDQVYVLTNGGPGFATQVISTYVYKAFGEGFLGRSTALGLILTIVVFIFAGITSKLLRQREVEG